MDDQGNRTGEVVGEMLTESSFHNDKGDAVNGAVIDPSDKSGENFIEDEIKSGGLGLIEYMKNAVGGEKYDFKRRGTSPEDPNYNDSRYHYRGMSFDGKIASARDIGNYAAGYIAGKSGIGWDVSRLGFDALESYQRGELTTEGLPTKRAQRVGHNDGYRIYQKRKMEGIQNKWHIKPKY